MPKPTNILKKLKKQEGPTTPFTFLTPMFDRIIVRRDEVAKQTEAGIIITDNTREKEAPNSGIVLSVGEGRLCPEMQSAYFEHEGGKGYVTKGCHVEPLRVKVGDHILFNSYAGTAIVDPKTDETLLLMQEDDVLAVINPEYLSNGQETESAAKPDATPAPAAADPVSPAPVAQA